jgi:hypothetical protein
VGEPAARYQRRRNCAPSLRCCTSSRRPAASIRGVSGSKCVDNSVSATRRSIGSGVEDAPFQRQDGDVLMLDNLLCAHGRNLFSGPREVLVALLDR